jgi:hypothetical protein
MLCGVSKVTGIRGMGEEYVREEGEKEEKKKKKKGNK